MMSQNPKRERADLLSCHEITESVLRSYLERRLTNARQGHLTQHLDHCSDCQVRWNRFRWDRAKAMPGYREFVQFLYEQREPLLEYVDSSRALITEWRNLPSHDPEAREAFFRSTPYYLYNLVMWHESGHRPGYVTSALPQLHQLGTKVICDYGCGIGSDGLRFLGEGYQVLFCEFDNPASRFLRWRLQQCGRSAHWMEPQTLLQEQPFDTLWAIDVFDHIPDLWGLAPLLERCRIVCYENDAEHKSHGGDSYHIPHSPSLIAKILTRCGFHRVGTTALLNIWSKTVSSTNE